MSSGIRSARTISFVMVAFASVAIGCGAAPEATGDVGPVSGIYGTALYQKNVGPDHAIGFYEFGPGAVGIRESMSVDNGEAVILDGSWNFDTLADVYARLNPTAKDVPSTILDADHRIAELRARQARQTELRAAPAIAAASTPVAEQPSAGTIVDAPKGGSFAPSATNCSADGFGDNWGAKWFLDRNCNQGGFRWCPTNLAWGNSGEYSASWSSWRQMEGDFNVPGHISATRITCDDFVVFTQCYFRTVIIDHDVLPRHIENWTYTDGNDFYAFGGKSPCGHQHTAFLRN